MASVSSYITFKKEKKTQREEFCQKISRHATTDYRLVYSETGDTFLCFGACIRLDRSDVDFPYFAECGRTGVTVATVHGSGALEFCEEQGCDEYVFAEKPPVVEPPSDIFVYPDVVKPAVTTIVLELV